MSLQIYVMSNPKNGKVSKEYEVKKNGYAYLDGVKKFKVPYGDEVLEYICDDEVAFLFCRWYSCKPFTYTNNKFKRI